MANTFTTTSRQGFFSRIFNSFLGILLGPVLVIGAIFLLSWNEGRAVQAIVGLADAAKMVVEVAANAVSPLNEGKLVHVIGPATADAPIIDSELNLSFPGQVAIARTVEMYQWKEKKEEKTQNNTGGSQTTTTTYTYSKDWSDGSIDSAGFAHPEGHQNPAMPFSSSRYTASDARLGGFTLDSETLGLVDLTTPLKPAPPQGWSQSSGNLYRSVNPAVPAIGDLRVHYTSLPAGTTISVLAQQSRDGFAAFTTGNGYQVQLTRLGNAPAGLMIAEKKKAESTLTWILRGVGALVMFIGFSMFFAPLSTLASVIPFLGSLVRGATLAFAFVLTIPITLVTIAIAWLAFRPLIGGALLTLAAISLYALWRWHHGRTAVHVAAQSSAPTAPEGSSAPPATPAAAHVVAATPPTPPSTH